MQNLQITMYATSWCPSCNRARAYLDERGLSYTEHDVDGDAEAKERLKQLNPRGSIPTFDIDGQVKVGFSPGGLAAVIEKATRHRMARF